MIYILIWTYIFLNILQLLVFADVILSWLTLLWLRLRPQFLRDLLDPIYENIKKILPTTIWPLDLTPIIVIFLCIFLQWLLIYIAPEIRNFM